MRTIPSFRRSAGIALLVAAVAACSSSTPKAGAPASSTTSGNARATPARCTQPAVPPKVIATKVAGVASDRDLSSFDATLIRLHWFPAPGASETLRAPTILMGPGWGLAGDTSTSDAGSPTSAVLSAASIASLWHAGYNVLT